jgi:hypothetical protein
MEYLEYKLDLASYGSVAGQSGSVTMSNIGAVTSNMQSSVSLLPGVLFSDRSTLVHHSLTDIQPACLIAPPTPTYKSYDDTIPAGRQIRFIWRSLFLLFPSQEELLSVMLASLFLGLFKWYPWFCFVFGRSCARISSRLQSVSSSSHQPIYQMLL